MTDEEFDALLRRALEDNIRAEYPDVFDPNVEFPRPPFSRRYLRWEKKLLADPVGFARKQARPMWKKALRAAACFLLCAATVLGAMLALSPSARAWVVDRTIDWLSGYTKFRFNGDNARGVTEDWRPAYLPDGFMETEIRWDEDLSSLDATWEDANGQYIMLIAMPARSNFSFNVDNEHSEYFDIEIQGQPASLFSSNTEGFPSNLIWTNADMSTAFVIMSNLPPEEIIAIAESGP